MKASAAFLVGSLALNCVLGIALLFPPAAVPRVSASPVADIAAGATTLKSAAARTVTDGSWADLTGGEWPEVVARLRAAKIHPRMIRAILAALVAERLADKHQAIVTAMTAKPWWEGQPWEPYSDPKITAMRRQLNREERDILYQLLGPETPVTEYDRHWREHRYGQLSPEQVERFRRINSDYDDLMAEARDRAKGIILPEDREKLAYLEEEKRQDVEKLLTAEERFEFGLRSSPTAKRLRDQLAGFEPTEAEFRDIFRIHEAIDARFAGGRVANLSQEERRQRRDAINAAEAQIKAVLSPVRFEEYQRVLGPRGSATPKN